ncbi:MAG TPA: RAD55 family ATPase [Nitrososphaerales archaeon]|nr:RAD55 family ATPase [Nitrososphaerales archaeon]
MERLPLGVPDMDQAMLGGIPLGSLCLVLGPPGAGKSILSKRFLYTGVEAKKDVFLVATSEGEDRALETMSLFNWNRGVERHLRFLDCYSWKSGKSTSKYSASLTSLTDLSVGITSIIDDAKVQPSDQARIVIDSFTDVINYGGPERALRLLDTVHTKLQTRGVTGLVLLEEGVHDEKTVKSVEYATDGTIRMKFSEQGRFMMVSRLTATPLSPKWIPFTIGR